MAKPTAPTELGAAKVAFLSNAAATTPASFGLACIQSSTSGEATYPVGWMGIATHRDSDTATSPAGFSGLATAFEPVVLIAGKFGTAARSLAAANTTPGAADIGLVVRNIPSGTQPVSGTVSATCSGTLTSVTTVSTVTAVTAITNALPAGAAALGAIRKFGWDHAGLAPQRGLSIGTSNTTENTLLSADASNLYNVVDVAVSWYAGSTAGSGATYLSFRHGVAGTEFLRVNLPIAANDTMREKFTFEIPSRSSTNQAVTVQLNAAGGTSYQYSAAVHAYKTTT